MVSGNTKGNRVAGNKSWKKFKGFCRYCGMQGHKASDCTVKKQRIDTSNGNKGENLKNNCFNCGKPGHYSKNCTDKKYNNLGWQQKLFVGHVGEYSVHMAQEIQQAHKNNRDWHLDTSSSDNNSDNSNNNMNLDEDSETSGTNRLNNNNNNDNNNTNIIHEDDGVIDVYEPTDPDNFMAKLSNIASWTHDDLVHNTVIGVRSFMTYWDMHSYRWYCYNCNQQLVSTGTDLLTPGSGSVLPVSSWRHLREPMSLIGILVFVDAATTFDLQRCDLPPKPRQYEHLCSIKESHEDLPEGTNTLLSQEVCHPSELLSLST
jgi:Zinc knuckle